MKNKAKREVLTIEDLLDFIDEEFNNADPEIELLIQILELRWYHLAGQYLCLSWDSNCSGDKYPRAECLGFRL